MSDNFTTIRKFSNPHDANVFVDILKKSGINYMVKDISPSFDITFTNSEVGKEIHIQVKSSNFEKVEKILEQEYQISEDEIPKNHYLLEFTDDELYEVIEKSDEWSQLDFNISKMLLKKRGRKIDEQTLKNFKKARIYELSLPDESQQGWIIAGYIFAVLGGFLGIFIGYHLYTFKKTLPDGSKYYGHNQNDRLNGQYILILSIFFTTLWLIIRFLN